MSSTTDFHRLADTGWSITQIQRLGVDARGKTLTVDGIVGPKTLGGTYLDPATVEHELVQVALKELLAGAREQGGNNAGEWVAKYVRKPHVERRKYGAWCAAFVSWCLREAYGAGTPYILGARRLVNRLRKAYTPVALEDIQVGDVIAWKRTSRTTQYAGHVGIVAHVDDEIIMTIEGNSGPRGAVRVWAYDRHDPSRGATGPLWGIGRLT